MRMKTTTGELKTALAKFADIVPTKPYLPVLACVKIEGKSDGSGVTIVGTNTDITVQTSLACEVETPDTFVVPYRLLAAIANSAVAGSVVVESVGDGKVGVTTKSGKSHIATMVPELFPRMTREDTERAVTLPCAEVEKMLTQVAFAPATPDQKRKNLEGTLIEVCDGEIRAVATNGIVLAISSHHLDVPVPSEFPRITLPQKSSVAIRKLLADGDVKVLLPEDKSYAVFETSDTIVKTKLIDLEYPNYRNVVPDMQSPLFSLSVDSATLCAAVKRTSVLSTFNESGLLKCDFSSRGISLAAQAEGIGDTQESVEVSEFSGSETVINLSSSLFISALASATSGTAHVAKSRKGLPIVIDDGKGYKAIVMPMRT